MEPTVSRLFKYATGFALLCTVAACTGGEIGADPENDQVKQVPNACTLVSEKTIKATLGDTVSPEGNTDANSSHCTWTYRNTTADGPRPFQRTLSVHATLHRSNGEQSGANAALKKMMNIKKRSQGSMQDFTGVGDSAIRATTERGVEYVAVSKNVTFTMAYEGKDFGPDGAMAPMPADEAKSEGLQLAQEIANTRQN